MLEIDKLVIGEVPNNKIVSLPLDDGTMFSKAQNICPNWAPFSLSRLEDYLPIIGERRIERLLKTVEKAKGIKILELNSSPCGGGGSRNASIECPVY